MSGSTFDDPFAALDEAAYIADVYSRPAYIRRLVTGQYRVLTTTKKIDRRIVCVINSTSRRVARPSKIRRGV